MKRQATLRVFPWHASDDQEVCLCAVGSRTPVGLDSASTAAAVRAAISGISQHPVFVDKMGTPMQLASDHLLEPDVPLRQRLEQLLAAALEEVTANLSYRRAPLHCWIGMPELRPGFTPEAALAAARTAADTVGTTLDEIHPIQHGHAAGLMTIQAVAQQITKGRIEWGIGAGVDSYHDPETVEWLDGGGQLMSACNRNGYPPGEASGACLLASRSAAERIGLPVLAHVIAACTTVEPNPIRSQRLCIGEGLSAAIAGATSRLRLPHDAVTTIYCDINGERYRNEEFAYALLRTQGAFIDAHNYLCPADCWGDVGAASGPLFAMLAVASSQRGYAKGGRPILWASSEGGYRSAVVLALGRD